MAPTLHITSASFSFSSLHICSLQWIKKKKIIVLERNFGVIEFIHIVYLKI